MVFTAIRVPVFFIVAALYLLCASKGREAYELKGKKVLPRSRTHWIYAGIIALLAYGIATCVPFERSIVKFDTLEEAYNYSSNEKIVFVEETENNAFVLGAGKSDRTVTYTQKKDNKWLYPFSVYYYVRDYQTGEVFLYCSEDKTSGKACYFSFSQNDSLEISDNVNGAFSCYEIPPEYKWGYFYYSVVPLNAENYIVTVDGTNYNL